MKNKFSFTVLVAIHQRKDIERNFENVIKSIYNNTLKPNNVLILIDGIINQDFKKKIKNLKFNYNFDLYHHPKNIGLANILNIGLSQVNTDWVIRSDGDDFSSTDRFENIMNTANMKTSIIGSFVNEIDSSGFKRLKKVPLNQKNILKTIKYKNPFNHNSVAYNLKDVLKVGGYPNYYLKEDYGLWIKMISKGLKGTNLALPLVEANFDDNSYKRRGGLKYIRSELQIFNLLYEKKLINLFEKYLFLFLRVILFSMPIKLKKHIYSYR